MKIALTPNLEQFIRDQVRTGHYSNASEVVREAVHLLKRTEERHTLKLEKLRSSIAVGDLSLVNGAFTDVSSGEGLDAFFDGFHES